MKLTPKSKDKQFIAFNLRGFPTELAWKIREKATSLQMTVKEYVIQTLGKDSGWNLTQAVESIVDAAEDLVKPAISKKVKKTWPKRKPSTSEKAGSSRTATSTGKKSRPSRSRTMKTKKPTSKH